MVVSEQIIQVLEALAKKFGVVIDWGSKNVLPYVQTLCEKYIHWEICTSIMWLIIGVIMILIGAVLFVCDLKNDFDFVFLAVFGIASVILGFIIIPTQIFDIIRCNVFPELQILNYLSYLTS